jgi:hypothetical protein
LWHLKDNEMGHFHGTFGSFHSGSLHRHRNSSRSSIATTLALKFNGVVAPRRDWVSAFTTREGGARSSVTGLGAVLSAHCHGAFDTEKVRHAARLELKSDGVVDGVELSRKEIHVLVHLIEDGQTKRKKIE